MKASSRAGMGQGWHKQSVRHSNARKTGTAGGTYSAMMKDKSTLSGMRNYYGRIIDTSTLLGLKEAEVYKAKLEKIFNRVEVKNVGFTDKVMIKGTDPIDEENNSPVVELPVYQIKGKQYYRDVRLGEYRNVKDPSDTLDINISNEELEKPTMPYPSFVDEFGRPAIPTSELSDRQLKNRIKTLSKGFQNQASTGSVKEYKKELEKRASNPHSIFDLSREDRMKEYKRRATILEKKATPEQKKVLKTYEEGDENLFLNEVSDDITPEEIDRQLQINVNSVEGDTTQMPKGLATYAKKKGWLEGF